ncbi:hypothetical protein D3C87_35260 [compost metagenome]
MISVYVGLLIFKHDLRGFVNRCTKFHIKKLKMNKILPKIAFFFLFIRCSLVYGQVSDSEMEKLKTKWRAELCSEGTELATKRQRMEGVSAFSDSINRLFIADTFVVENLLRRQLRKDPTTLGMNKANLACASEYEVLVEKYFQILLIKMKEEDAELLISWQKEWKALQDKERPLIGKLMQEEYSGGGSIQSLTYTGRLMKAQKDHLLQLMDYLAHLI